MVPGDHSKQEDNMKMAAPSLAVVATAVVTMLPFPVAAQQLTEQEAHRIVEKGIEALNEAFRITDAAAAAAVFAEDAIRVLPRGVVQGRAAITQGYAAMLGNKDWEEDPDKVDQVRVLSNDVILATGSWSGTYKGTTHLHGYWSSTVERQGDAWKIVMGTVTNASDR
jgi:uncharacterized protein (TIGR02246 family)